MRTLKILAMIALATTILAGCSSGAATPKSATVNATLTDMKISLDKTSVPAGEITFVVKNAGAIEHELVVIKTDVAQDKLAPDADEAGKMDEDGNVGETGDMNAGTSKTFTITLAAGHYVLMCNEVGHYGLGMHMAFTVN
jgi:uncharacterized cupredoxin-like copper-binding protein